MKRRDVSTKNTSNNCRCFVKITAVVGLWTNKRTCLPYAHLNQIGLSPVDCQVLGLFYLYLSISIHSWKME